VLDREGTQTSSDTLTIFYAASIEDLQEAVWRAGGLFVGASVLLLLAAAAVAVWTIKRGLSPLAQLASGAAQVSPANWELRASPDSQNTVELAPLTQAMTTMLAKLQQAFTSQREFLADAAHELKTPVAILKSTLQSLAQRSRTPDEYRAGVEGALEDTLRLEKLVHSMLRLARAEQRASGSLRGDLEEIDLTGTCEMAIAHLTPLAESRHIELEFNRHAEPKLRADAEDLELVWRNLLQNAIQYSPSDTTVQMTISRNGDHAEVAVCDRGAGIPQEQVERIFDRFHRADTSRARNTGGYGLGLAISKAIVEAYGGNITVETAVGSGTTMTVRLPLNV
jgi:heavy metal sensor kinase